MLNLRRQVVAMAAAVIWLLLAVSIATADEHAAAEPTATSAVPSSNPMSGDAEAIETGHQLYRRWCLQCHGVKGDGVSPRWGKHGGDLRVFWRGFGEFVSIVLNGIPEKFMPPWQEYLRPDEIAQIGAYLETLAVEGANWQ